MIEMAIPGGRSVVLSSSASTGKEMKRDYFLGASSFRLFSFFGADSALDSPHKKVRKIHRYVSISRYDTMPYVIP